MPLSRTLQILLAVVTLAVPASAQRADGMSIVSGDTVRVSGAGLDRAEGVLVSLDTASVLVQRPGVEARLTIPRAAITGIEVLRGVPVDPRTLMLLETP